MGPTASRKRITPSATNKYQLLITNCVIEVLNYFRVVWYQNGNARAGIATPDFTDCCRVKKRVTVSNRLVSDVSSCRRLRAANRSIAGFSDRQSGNKPCWRLCARPECPCRAEWKGAGKRCFA